MALNPSNSSNLEQLAVNGLKKMCNFVNSVKSRVFSATAVSLLCLLCGVVDRLIMNNDLDKGTQIPYIERAMKEGYEVVILNTNLNKFPDGSQDGGSKLDIPVT